MIPVPADAVLRILLDFQYFFVGVGYLYFVAVVEAADVVVDADFGEVSEWLGAVAEAAAVLDDKPIVHLAEALHVPGDVVLDVLDAADFEDHVFVYGVTHSQLPAGLDV